MSNKEHKGGNTTVLVDVAKALLGWRVCHHYPANPESEAEIPALTIVQYVNSQQKYIS